MKIHKNLLLVSLIVFLATSAFATTDQFIKERKQFGKPIRTKMPPQLIIENIQAQFNANSPEWKTFWQTFVVEDDEFKDEFVIVARSAERSWSFSLLKPDCPKPENYNQLINESKTNGTPIRMDVLIGVKRQKSWFRYVVNVYEPMYEYWKNPCVVWSLPPGGIIKDAFYNENYTMKSYAENLGKNVYKQIQELANWKPPIKAKKIPVIRGPGQELVGGESDDLLTDEERKTLTLKQQEKLLIRRQKEREKELKIYEKELKKAEKNKKKE